MRLEGRNLGLHLLEMHLCLSKVDAGFRFLVTDIAMVEV